MIPVRELVEMLVAVKSVSNVDKRPTNKAIVDAISNLCEDAGCLVTQYPYLRNQQFNVVATKGGEEPCFALSGHTDTMPYDEADWDVGKLPLAVCEHNGSLYGRGVCDMKLALATNIAAASMISEHQLKRPFALYFTAEEEIGCLGAKSLVKESSFKLADQIVVCEPTGLRVGNRHKGYMFMTVEVARVVAEGEKVFRHSSDDRHTTNALKAYIPEVVTALREIEAYLRTITNMYFDPPYTTMNLGDIKVSDDAAKNTIPISFTLFLDVRPIPGVEMTGIVDLLIRKIEREVKSVKTIGTEVYEYKVKPKRQPTPAFLNLDSQLPAMFGEDDPIPLGYNSEAGVFQAAGADCVVYGPGLISDAHIPNESISLRYLEPSVVDSYAKAILSVCGR